VQRLAQGARAADLHRGREPRPDHQQIEHQRVG